MGSGQWAVGSGSGSDFNGNGENYSDGGKVKYGTKGILFVYVDFNFG